MLAAMIFGTVQQFGMSAEPAADDFDSLVPEPAPERPLTGRGRTSLPEPDED